MAQDSEGSAAEDKVALLSFRAAGDPDDDLASWDEATEPCGEGWDGAELASSPHYACCEGAWVPLLEELRVLSVPFRGKQRQSTP